MLNRAWTGRVWRRATGRSSPGRDRSRRFGTPHAQRSVSDARAHHGGPSSIIPWPPLAHARAPPVPTTRYRRAQRSLSGSPSLLHRESGEGTKGPPHHRSPAAGARTSWNSRRPSAGSRRQAPSVAILASIRPCPREGSAGRKMPSPPDEVHPRRCCRRRRRPLEVMEQGAHYQLSPGPPFRAGWRFSV